MPYIVYETATREVVSAGIKATSAAAATLAATDADWSAYASEVTGNDFDPNAEPGWFLTTAGKIVREIPVAPIELTKAAAWAAHDYLSDLWEQLHAEGAGHPWAEVVLVHDFFVIVHKSNFRIVSENPNSLSAAVREAYLRALPDGPVDATGARETISSLFAQVVANPVGTAQGITFVNPSSAVQLTMTQALNTQLREAIGLGPTTGTFSVTEAQLASGTWIDSITP